MEINTLDVKQLKIIESFINGENIFMSGPAGTGKSYLIKIIQELCEKHYKKCQVTALTGCAALLLNCQAKTIHSWSGINIKNYDITINLNKIKKNKKIINWIDIDILIVDEISMMSPELFDLLDLIGKTIRKNDKPFGGIQLIFSGDFFQLPPINETNCKTKFCFESDLWDKTFSKIHILTKIYRQEDKEFSKILNEVRIGKLRKSTENVLKSRVIPYENNNNIIPTIILPRTKAVENINKKEHNALTGKRETFVIKINKPKNEAHTKFYEIKQAINFIEENNPPIEFKIGDQVICTRNISDSIVNGSRGVIIDIKSYPIVRFHSGIETEIGLFDIPHENIKGLIYKKIPLDYAWALTIHKCQGMTLDLCIMDIGKNIFECGQTYVALSRVKNLEGLYLISFDSKSIKTKTIVKGFYNKYEIEKLSKQERISEKKRLRKLINRFNEDILEKSPEKSPEKSKELNMDLLNELKKYRLDKSKEKNIPVYCILNNYTIELISEYIPKSNAELLSIKGIGETKLELYGNDINDITKKY